MAQFEPLAEYFQQHHTSVVFVAAEKRTGLFRPEEYFRKHPISFPFLLDEDRSVSKSYGVYHRLGWDTYNIARPASFVLSPSGEIGWIYVGQNQRDRSSMEALKSEIDRLSPFDPVFADF